jgi:1-pyrroline-5-carboxylate dehydrogenase
MDAVTQVPTPENEPVLQYAPGSPERADLEAALAELQAAARDLPHTIGGRRVMGSGEPIDVRQPHAHRKVLGTLRNATADDARSAVDAAMAAGPGWRALSFDDRASIFLKAAELLSGPWRARLNAATMLGQSKTCYQAEIDSACELIDFWRMNAHFARQILADQPPLNAKGVWNRTDHRPLEGFVYAITPFNFTAIAGNLPASAALMGCTVVWKPAESAAYSGHFLMRLLQEAGLPDGVINLVHGPGSELVPAALAHADLAGVHFTGSTAVFHGIWSQVGENVGSYRNYPRLVGETGGKDFVVAHRSADPEALVTALVRGSFEYQGQKCSASSRVFVPESLWPGVRDRLADQVASIPMGDVADFRNFMGAVINRSSFDCQVAAIAEARSRPGHTVLVGGGTDDSVGWFVQPTVVVTEDPESRLLRDELFGPVVTVMVYPDAEYEATLDLIDRSVPYALTGSVFANDRLAIETAHQRLRYSAGNFYVNDKPTGAVVGQQPFGGSRASGTNDKAGSLWNLARWVSPRTIKETLSPPRDWRYPFMG